MRRTNRLTLGVTAAAVLAATTAFAGSSTKSETDSTSKHFGQGPAYLTLGDLAVLHTQSNGSRIKPVDTFARLLIKQIYGREDIKILPREKDEPTRTWTALAALFDWPVRPEFWDQQEIILIDLFDYRGFKRRLLTESIKGDLKAIAAKSSTSAEDKAALEKLGGADEVSEADLNRLLARESLPEADRATLNRWADKLADGRKWISPADLEAAVVEVDGRRIGFLDWFGETFDRARDARQRGESYAMTPEEKKVAQVGERLLQYQGFRDHNPRAIADFDLLVVPRPVNQAYLKFTGNVIKTLLDETSRDKQPSALAMDAFHTLQSYLEDLKSIRNYVKDVRDGKQKLPGEDPKFDPGFTKWLQKKSSWVPLRIVMESDLDELASAGFPREKVEAFRKAYHDMEAAEKAAPGQAAKEPAEALVAAARALGEANNSEYPPAAEMARETHFNRFAPFSQAPWYYGSALVLLLISLGITSDRKSWLGKFDLALYSLGLTMFLTGILMEIYGFYLRVRISGWAPVTNMYETVIWVALVSSVLGLALELIYRRKYAATAAAGVAMLGTLLAANVPLLDPNIGPLTAVLRDNYWLTVHVLTIVSSYAAFSLAMGLGILAVGYYLSATYRRDVPYSELGMPLLAGLPLVALGSIGLLMSSQGWASGVLSNTPGYFLTAGLTGLGGILTIVGLFGLLGELANRHSTPAMMVGLAIFVCGLAGVFSAMQTTPPEWWPSQIPVTFPPGIVAIVGFGLVVMSLLGAQSRASLRAAEADLSSLDETAPQSRETETGDGDPDHVASASDYRHESRSAVATLSRPSVSEIRARAMATRPKLDPRGQAMQATAAQIKPLSNFIYRAMQVGVLLVAAGTILGGVWADVSWGRFWGWDPKEVWALITLLVYLVPLHGRFAGWVNTFGLVAASVACYMSVLMAWYGVNFVLGVGLHSYGFTDGGGQGVVVSSALGILAIVGAAAWRRSLGLKQPA